MSACGQGRRVVDAVADHRHDVPLLPQRAHLVRLLGRQHLGQRMGDAGFAGDGFGRVTVVAREQVRLDAHASEPRHDGAGLGRMVSATVSTPMAAPSWAT